MELNALVDASVLISFLNSDDVNHQKAIRLLDTYNKTRLFVSEHVVDEVSTVLIRRNLKKLLKDFIWLFQAGYLEVYSLGDSNQELVLVKETWLRLLDQKNKASFTDVYQEVLAEKYKFKILTFDHHFSHHLVLPEKN